MKWVIRIFLMLALAFGGFLAFMLVPGYLVPLPEPEAAAPPPPTTPEAWRDAALADLAAAKKLLEDHTPIPFDDQNPGYRQWLTDGFEKAKGLAAQARDEHGHYFAVSYYVNGFQDPHVAFGLNAERPDPLWPGFIAAKKGAKAVIVYRDPGDPDAPHLGAVIAACDGLDLETFARERILPYVGNAKIALEQRQAVGRIFLDRHNPFVARIEKCDFETPQGVESKVLNWRPIPKDAAERQIWYDAYRDASTGPRAEWGVSEPVPGVTWIGVPTFSSGEDTAPKLKKLIADVEAKAAAFRQGRAIVIDTRGNGGGNTFWSSRLTNAIFPSDVIKGWSKASGQSAADWRASEGNARFWRRTSREYATEFGPVSIESLGALYLAGAIWAHKDDKPPIWRFPWDGDPSPTGGLTLKRPKSGKRPFPAMVFFLTNGTCGSTCLNFADEVLMIPGVKLIGSATHADGAYMEIRDVPLPSGLGRINLPQKVWRGMGRGNLESYAPDVPYEGSWSDKEVRSWVLSLVTEQAPPRSAACRSSADRDAGGIGVCRLPARSALDMTPGHAPAIQDLDMVRRPQRSERHRDTFMDLIARMAPFAR